MNYKFDKSNIRYLKREKIMIDKQIRYYEFLTSMINNLNYVVIFNLLLSICRFLKRNENFRILF